MSFMTFVHVLPALHELVILASTKKSSSSSSSAFLFILLILAVGAFLFMRPQRRRQREQQATQKAISVGDEVITTSGIIGTVRAMNDDRVLVEIAPGTTVEIVRRAVGQRVPQAPTYPEEPISQTPPTDGAAAGHEAEFEPPLDDGTKEADEPMPSFPSPSPKPDPDAEQSQTGEGKSG
jgi:preprotein translocase subunit YajC